jgi:hypothetical protein
MPDREGDFNKNLLRAHQEEGFRGLRRTKTLGPPSPSASAQVTITGAWMREPRGQAKESNGMEVFRISTSSKAIVPWLSLGGMNFQSCFPWA